MIVEVKGIGIPNKGAELMLVAVMQALNAKYKGVQFVVDPNTDFIGRCRFGLYQKAWMNIKGVQTGYLYNYLPQKLLSRFGLVKDKDINVVIDASGFCYSDSFGFANAYEQVGRYIQNWRAKGKKYIFLPQAYGPFNDPNLAELMKKTLQQANCFFARDRVSQSYLKKLLPDLDIPLSPDFTCLVKGQLPEDFNPESCGDTCIILNNRMLEKADHKDGQAYIDNSKLMIEKLIDMGYKPYFLLHEGQDDVELTARVNALLDIPLHSYFFDNPEHIKGVIGSAKLVISSRFHGLVSALSQGVPALAMGWSHKYKMLMEDYQSGDLLINHLDFDSIRKAIEYISIPENYNRIQDIIITEYSNQVEQSKKMWEKVFQEIDC